MKNTRIAKYKSILGAENKYRDDIWFNKAVGSDLPGNYFFKKDYTQSDWYLFQNEIIRHQDDSYKILQSLFETTEQKNEWVTAE